MSLLKDLEGFDPADVTEIESLDGGVSSDIFVLWFSGNRICVKFALDELKVAETWRVPTSRNASEYRWLATVGSIAPESVPRLYGYSRRAGGFAMAFIEGDEAYQWKAALLDGMADDGQAAAVADLIGLVHARTALPHFEADGFDNLELFEMIRIEPHLRFTASRYCKLAQPLNRLATSLRSNRLTLIHGDVSPKNILFRKDVPILLDAECATMGDPCFDVAFCLNHLVLKAIHLPVSRANLFQAAQAFIRHYRGHVDWEEYKGLDARVAALLPALMLARVDGKSPVEYLDDDASALVRAIAVPLIATPVADTDAALCRIERRLTAS